MYGFEFKYSYEKRANGLEIFGPAKDGNSYVLKYTAHGPEFNIVAASLEEATYINHLTGKPFVRTSILYREIFKKAIIYIEFPDNKELEPRHVEKIDLNKENYNLIKMICKHWIKEVL